MKVMRQFGRMLEWAGQHPATALMILLTLWAAVLAVRAKLTEHARFNRTFADAVWDWSQAGANARPLSPNEREKLFEQLASPEPAERWMAAGTLASWRESAALWPLVAAMEDAEGTRRTCVISFALGKLDNPAAVPALIEAARQRSNVDLRVCATHSLGRIGAESAVRFLAKRSADPSVNQGDRSVAISALGEIGSPSALPALQALASTGEDPMLRSFAASAIRQIGLLEGDAIGKLLGAIGDNRDWIQDDWILAQLHRRWNDRIVTRLNELLRANRILSRGLKLQITALLAAKHEVNSTTMNALARFRARGSLARGGSGERRALIRRA